jgi:serine/threonine-protein kinase
VVERFVDSRQVCHADFTIIARMAGDLIAGRYRLLETLGQGPMSSVWLAEDEELGRRVAVKTLAPSADRARFEREARAAAALSHPNICSLYDYGEADGKLFMVLEYLPNGSLEERLRAGPLSDDETTRIATELAAGLAHAHARGLVHRDLKPANVLFDVEGRAKIADFGIARMVDNLGLTEAGTVLGTASYISPEQAAGRPAGPASDVYSFGVILFRMLTGRLPFVSSNAMELVRMHRDDPPPAVTDVRPDVPPRLASITTAALAKDAAARPADGAALLRELRGDTDDATIVAGPGAFPPVAASDATQVLRPAAAARKRRRLPLVPLIIALAVLLGAGVALALALSGGGDGNGSATQETLPSLSLPSVPSATTQATTTEATTAATSTEATTTAPTTTARTTTAPTPPTTTAPVTTRPVTTAPVTTLPVTTVPPVTTAPVTTAPPPPVTTDTTPTTTAAAPLQGTTTAVVP